MCDDLSATTNGILVIRYVFDLMCFRATRLVAISSDDPSCTRIIDFKGNLAIQDWPKLTNNIVVQCVLNFTHFPFNL